MTLDELPPFCEVSYVNEFETVMDISYNVKMEYFPNPLLTPLLTIASELKKNIISGDKGKAATITKTGTARTKSTSTPHKGLMPVKDLIPAHKKSIPVKDLISGHTPNKDLIPVHKFLGGLYPAP